MQKNVCPLISRRNWQCPCANCWCRHQLVLITVIAGWREGLPKSNMLTAIILKRRKDLLTITDIDSCNGCIMQNVFISAICSSCRSRVRIFRCTRNTIWWTILELSGKTKYPRRKTFMFSWTRWRAFDVSNNNRVIWDEWNGDCRFAHNSWHQSEYMLAYHIRRCVSEQKKKHSLTERREMYSRSYMLDTNGSCSGIRPHYIFMV